MFDTPTIGALYQSGEVAPEDLDAVIAGWLEDRIEGAVPLSRHAVDVSSAVEAYEPARDALADDTLHEERQRAAIREAIIQAPAARA
jgi:phosphoribosylanthranilate isomerase